MSADHCEIMADGRRRAVRFAGMFPSPRVERVLPGHLVAIAAAPDRCEWVIWRWYDAVVLGEEAGLVRLWEPAHGEVLAAPRGAQPRRPGTRAYLTAGLPGAEWWVAGPVVAAPAEADVELDAVHRFFTDFDLWSRLR